MCQTLQQQFTAVQGMVNVQTANTSLDGTGTLNLLLSTLANGNGTVIKTITIKAAASNVQGVIRFFVQGPTGGGKAFLWKEVPVPQATQSPTTLAYQTTVKTSYILPPGSSLLVTTQNAENWNFIAEGVEWTNCPCPVQ